MKTYIKEVEGIILDINVMDVDKMDRQVIYYQNCDNNLYGVTYRCYDGDESIESVMNSIKYEMHNNNLEEYNKIIRRETAFNRIKELANDLLLPMYNEQHAAENEQLDENDKEWVKSLLMD